MNVCLIHPFDPRGDKVGGLETYIRDFIRFHPADMNLLMIGVDGRGDLRLGEAIEMEVQDRTITFIPVVRYDDAKVHQAATSIGQSITFQFAAGLAKHAIPLKRRLRKGRYSVDLRRVEFSHFCKWAGVPFTQMLHGEGAPKLKMDSLLGRYRYVHNLNEAFAMKHCERFLCVNPMITERIKSEYPAHAAKISTLTTWYNPEIYKPTPFQFDGDTFRIVFCGRLDLFKAPALIFRTIAALKRKLATGKVELHYVGTSDPTRFPEFEAVRADTVLHGFQRPQGIARILECMHAGILTSEFEGMPRFTLETLGAGRPTAAIHLPQLETVIEDGVSGYLIGRASEDEMVDILSDRFVQLWNDIRDGRIEPGHVAAKAGGFTPDVLLGRVYGYHREIHARRAAA